MLAESAVEVVLTTALLSSTSLEGLAETVFSAPRFRVGSKLPRARCTRACDRSSSRPACFNSRLPLKAAWRASLRAISSATAVLPAIHHHNIERSPMNTPASVIDARGLVREYRTGGTVVRALDGVSLVVEAGEFVALIGTSGSGKSTLLSILGCLDQPTEGSYHLNGVAVEALDQAALASTRNQRIGFVFQSFNLLSRLPADENVALPLRYAGWDRSARLVRAREILGRVGLADRTHHTPGELSGGQCQRVAIARALVTDPDLILADEPTGNLDSRSGAEILALFAELHAEGRTVVMVTHDEHIAAKASRQIRLSDGRIISDVLNVRAEE